MGFVAARGLTKRRAKPNMDSYEAITKRPLLLVLFNEEMYR